MFYVLQPKVPLTNPERFFLASVAEKDVNIKIKATLKVGASQIKEGSH